MYTSIERDFIRMFIEKAKNTPNLRKYHNTLNSFRFEAIMDRAQEEMVERDLDQFGDVADKYTFGNSGVAFSTFTPEYEAMYLKETEKVLMLVRKMKKDKAMMASEPFLHSFLNRMEQCCEQGLSPRHDTQDLVSENWRAMELNLISAFNSIPMGQTVRKPALT